MIIPFNKPYMTGKELWNIAQSNANGHMAGDGPYTKMCHNWLEDKTKTLKALLTHSCTAALEMAAILSDIGPGDEVIMPSYTFVSTANAFAIRGATIIFVDIRPDTLNIDEEKIEEAITDRTKAIVPVHYAGVAAEMDKIMEVAEKYNLIVIEDAAQGIMSEYKNKPLGSIGHMGTLSFHETKNIISGEGGALLINDINLVERAEIIREKGTNRSQFFQGQVDKYTWVDYGSSYLPGEIISAFLYAQMEEADEITEKRLNIWDTYNQALLGIKKVKTPFIPEHCNHNAHMYYLLMSSLDERTDFIHYLKDKSIHTVFHYIPLHSSPAGLKVGKATSDMKNTNEISDRLVRLPLWIGIENYQEKVINEIRCFLGV